MELIGIDTLSHDLALIYPHIAKDELGIQIDTNQFFDVEDFVKAYDASLKGIDYIDHRKYLEERRRSLEKYQEKVELKEYLENADYA